MHVGLQTCSTAMVSLQLSKLAIFPSDPDHHLNRFNMEHKVKAIKVITISPSDHEEEL